MCIGNNLKNLRKAYSLSQKDLARILNTTQQHISHLETNLRHMDISELKILSDHFNIPCDLIVSEDFSIYCSSNNLIDFISHYQTLNPSDQELMRNLIHRLSNS